MDNSFAYQPATERYERMLYNYCGREWSETTSYFFRIMAQLRQCR